MDHAHLGKLYGFLFRKGRAFIREAFKDLNIEFSETILLVAVFQNPGLSQDEIAEDLTVDKAVVARRLKKLEAQGLVYRVPDKNSLRVKRVFPTELGLLYRQRIDPAMRYWHDATLSCLSQEEKDCFLQTILRVKEFTEHLKADDVWEDYKKNQGPRHDGNEPETGANEGVPTLK